jgi:hypothetical protein
MMNFAKKSLLLALLVISSISSAYDNRFPQAPDLKETPGKLCNKTGTTRYAERVSYCSRNVDSYLKVEIIKHYDVALGFQIRAMNRGDFKIDHLIPLCAGGSNDEDNLWPQHKSIYEITDPIEPLICDRMAEGSLSQAEAVRMIIYAKTHLEEAEQIILQLHSRRFDFNQN